MLNELVLNDMQIISIWSSLWEMNFPLTTPTPSNHLSFGRGEGEFPFETMEEYYTISDPVAIKWNFN